MFFFHHLFTGSVVFWHVSLIGFLVDGDITLVRLQMPPFVSRSQAKNAPTGIHILPGTPRNQFLNGCVCVLFVNMSHVKILGHPTENVAVFKRMAVGFQVPGMHLNLSF